MKLIPKLKNKKEELNMRFNKRKLLKLILVIMMILTIIFCFVASSDFHHLDTCEKEHCSMCAMIHMSQLIMQATVVLVFVILKMFFIQYTLSKIYYKYIYFKYSLLSQRVQFNE